MAAANNARGTVSATYPEHPYSCAAVAIVMSSSSANCSSLSRVMESNMDSPIMERERPPPNQRPLRISPIAMTTPRGEGGAARATRLAPPARPL